MATKANDSAASEETIKAAILDAVSELWDQHTDEIRTIRNNSQEKCITVTFGNEIDCSESQVTVKTKIRFCETFTDERTNKITVDDQKQGKFETMEAAGRGGRKGAAEPEPADAKK